MGWLILIVLVVVVAVVIIRSAAGEVRRRSSTQQVRSDSASKTRAPAPRRLPAPSRERRSPGRRFPLTWFGPDRTLEVAGIRIENPCVYASAGDFSVTDPSEILLQAPVRRSSARSTDLGYWPWYGRILPEQRYLYLAWLASGRSTLPPAEGLLFLFFYGIERRLLVDRADRAWALQEVVRLRGLDKRRADPREGASFRRYSTALLWYEIARTPERFNEKAFNTAASLTERWTPELLTAPLGWLAELERPLPAWLARQIAGADPRSQRSVVIKRIPKRFAELFEARYHEAFGDAGLELRVSKRPAWQTYRPASGGLDEARCKIPNPLGIKSQFKKLPDLWNSCVADLRKLSRVSGSAVGGGEITIEAWEAMPEELRADVDHPLTDEVSRMIGDADENGASTDDGDASPSMVPAGRFAELIGVERRPRLTATQSRKIAATLHHTGYGVVPDARISPIRYRWDDLVAVLPGVEGEVESARYNAAACVLRLGLSVAMADGEADELELRVLSDHIDAVFDLSSEEEQRLAALRDLLLRTGSDIRPIARKLQSMLPPDARRTLGRLLVAIAAETDGIDRSERNSLRKAFRALDLPPELLEETIAELEPESSDATVTVKRGRADDDKGEPIPAPAPAFQLNHEAISSIMTETRKVSVLLAEAMGAYDEEASSDDETDAARFPQTTGNAGSTLASASTAPTGNGPAPTGRQAPLFEALVQRDRWRRDEADRIAREHALMLDAAVEAINDWAFDALGAPLIEHEDDVLVVDRSLLRDG